MDYTCLSISPAFPRVGGKPDHVSSQGKEAVFAMHDIYVVPTRMEESPKAALDIHCLRQGVGAALTSTIN